MKSILLVLSLLTTCHPTSHVGVREDADELMILEAVFRDQITHCYQDRSPGLYFLSYKGGDPSDALMERLADNRPPVRRRSEMRGFKDRKTSEAGILLGVQDISRPDNTAADVKGFCGAASMDAYSYMYRVVRKDQKWVVEVRKLTGVS